MKKYKYRYNKYYNDVLIDVKANSETELVEKVVAKKEEIDRNLNIDRRLLVKDWVAIWLETYKEPSVSAPWYKEIERRLRPFLEDLGGMPLYRVTPTHLKKYMNRFSGKSEKYIRTNLNIIKELFFDAYADRLIKTNPAENLSPPKGKMTMERRSLTDYEQEVLLKAAGRSFLNYYVKFMYYCGLRPGESAALRWSDIDLEAGVVSISRALKKDMTIGPPKTKAGFRKVPIPKTFLEELRKDYKPGFEYVTTHNGSIIRQQSISSFWKRFRTIMLSVHAENLSAEKTKNRFWTPDDITPYMLRHTFCTNLEKQGVPINIAKVLMGHSSIEMTAKIYTHFDDDQLEMARAKMDAAEKVSDEFPM